MSSIQGRMPAPHTPSPGTSKAVPGSGRDKSLLCVRARGHLRVPMGAERGWAVGGTGTAETGADQKSASARQGGHAPELGGKLETLPCVAGRNH